MKKVLMLAASFIASVAPASAGGVLWVGWDGSDHRVVSDMLSRGELPSLARMRSFQKLEISGCATVTKPSWSEQASGLPCHLTGVRSNVDFRPLPEGSTVFEIARAAGRRVGIAASKCSGIEKDGNGGGNMCFGANGPGAPFERVTADFLFNGSVSTAKLERECLSAIAAALPGGFVFCHFGQVDAKGHAHGGGSPEQRAELRLVDAALGRLLAAAPGARVLLTSDHGFDVPADSHENAPLGIVASSGLQRLRPIGRDVFKTLMQMLDLPVPPGRESGRSIWLRD